MPKRTKLDAILHAKCPRCHEGDIFVHKAFHLSKFTETYEQCPHCGLHYEVEPGFFIGAMYVSYAMSVALFVTIVVALYNFFGDPSIPVYLTCIIGITFLLLPGIFRYSRVIYLHAFGGVKYDPKYE